MSARGLGVTASRARKGSLVPGSYAPPRGIVRLSPETWQMLATLRRPILDSEGNLVGLESFDRLVRRILQERRPPLAPSLPIGRQASR